MLGHGSGLLEAIDDIMEHWPLPSTLRAFLDDIKSEYHVRLLCVYKGEKEVSPEQTNDILKGALVEIHFKLRHFQIWKPPYNSYNGTMEQVIILQPGAPDSISAFKREDNSEGPICKKLNIMSAKEGPSHSDVVSDGEEVENSLRDGTFFHGSFSYVTVSRKGNQLSQMQTGNEKDKKKGKGKQL